MNPREIQLMRDIMTRVRAIHFMRRLLRPVPLKSAVLVISVVSATFLVSIPDVVGNMSQLPGIVEGVSYLAQAFAQTSPVVEAVIILALAAGCWLAYDIVRNMKYIKIALFHKKMADSLE